MKRKNDAKILVSEKGTEETTRIRMLMDAIRQLELRVFHLESRSVVYIANAGTVNVSSGINGTQQVSIED